MSTTLSVGKIPSSPLSRWDARWKFLGLTLSVVAMLTLQNPIPLGVATAMVLAMLLLSRASLMVVLQRLAVLWFSLLPVVVVLGFTLESGWLLSLAIVLRTTAIAGLLLVLLLTTSPSTLCASARQLGVPDVLVQVVALAWRYARLFLAELQRMRIAIFCRGFRLQTNGHGFQTLGYTAGTLLVRGADRSERVSEAMLARGFRGEYNSLEEFRTSRSDVLGFLFMLLVVSGLIVLDRLT